MRTYVATLVFLLSVTGSLAEEPLPQYLAPARASAEGGAMGVSVEGLRQGRLTRTQDVLTPGGTVSQIPDSPAFPHQELSFVPGAGARAIDPVQTTLTKTWNGATFDVNLAWAGNGSAVTVVTSSDPSFQTGVTTLGLEVPGATMDVTSQGQSPSFFDVADSSTLSRADQGMGYTPIPNPNVMAVSVNGLWWGDSLTVDGEYFDPIDAANVAFLYDRPVLASSVGTPSGGFSTSASFTIPDDARGGPLFLQAHGKSSQAQVIPLVEATPELLLYPRGVPAFTNINGIVYAPQTGNIWVAHDTGLQEIDIFLENPELLTSIAATQPYISRVTESGFFIYVEGGVGNPIIHRVDVTSGEESTYANTTDDGFTRQIRPVAIALSPLGGMSFIADASGGPGAGRIIKVFEGDVDDIIDGYGWKYDWSFPDPAGMDVSPLNYLFVSSTDTWIWEVIPWSSVQRVAPLEGFVPHSILVDRNVSMATNRFYFWENQGMAEVYNQRPVDEGDARFHGGFVWDEPDGHIKLTFNPFYKFYDHYPQRVILRTSAEDSSYTSQNQVADRVIRVKVHGWGGFPLKLRVIDPRDLAPYVTPTSGHPYEENDNLGTSDCVAALDCGLALTHDSTEWHMELVGTPGGDPDNPHVLTFYLKMPERYSGNNYQVEVTKCQGDEPTCTAGLLGEKIPNLSAVYTSWKRINVERDKMFREGGVLSRDYGAIGACGGGGQPACCSTGDELPCDQIEVYEWHNVVVGDQIVVFDTVNTYGSGAEERTVTVVEDPPDDPDDPNYHGLIVITLDQALQKSYWRSGRYEPDPPSTDPYQPNFNNFHSAGIGVISPCDADTNQINASNSCFFEGDLRGVERTYNDAYIEMYAPTGGMGVTPFLGQPWFEMAFYTPSLAFLVDFSRTWFENRGPGVNYFHVVAGSRSEEVSPMALWGYSSPEDDYTYVLREACEKTGEAQGQSSQAIDNFTQDTTSHELGHQWDLNCCTTGGHCGRNAWCQATGCGPGASDPEACVIAGGLGASSWNSVMRYCKEDLLLGDPTCDSGSPQCYDPMPPDWTVEETALRTASDPR